MRRFVVVSLAFAAALLPAAPAAAHGTDGTDAADYLVRILEVDPPVDGLRVRVIELGDRFELRNTTDAAVTVLGYEDEPYLRVRSDGVWRNERSPATYWNEETSPQGTPPESYDAAAEPRWEKISDEPAARWHDHRAHWMGARPSGGRQVLLEWSVVLDLEAGGGQRRVEVRGETVWVPPPSPWPWAAVAVGVAAITVAAGLVRRAVRPVVAIALVLLVAMSLLQVAGEWDTIEGGLGRRLAAEIYLLGAAALGVAAAWRAVRARSIDEVTPLTLLAGLLLLIAGGLIGLPYLGRSVLPTTLPASVVRALVAATLGLATAVIVVSGARLRPATEARVAARATPAE